MQFSMEQIQAFVAAAEHGSFSAAARHLGKAQSAVSTAIANLELDLDLILFDRTGRNPRLNDHGKEMLEKAYQLLEKRQEFLLSAQELHTGTESKLRLAIDQNLMGPSLVQCLQELAERYPNLVLDIVTPSGEEAWDKLSANEIDLALMISPLVKPPRHIRLRPCGWIKYCNVAAPSHPLAKRKSINIEHLRRHRQLVVQGDTKQNNATQLSHNIWSVDSTHVLWELLHGGLGWAAIAEHLAIENIKDGRLKRLGQKALYEHFNLPVDLASHISYVPGQIGKELLELLPLLTLFERD